MSTFTISVIVPTVNRPDDLQRCLLAIKKQDRPADEVVVVIGPGGGQAQAIVETVAAGDGRWRCIYEDRSSVICSLNRGIRESQGDIIALTDDDAAAPPGWLRQIESHYSRDPEIGAVGGKDRLIFLDRPHLPEAAPVQQVGTFNWHGMLVGNHHCGSIRSPVEVDVLKGVNLTFRRKAFSQKQINAYLIGSGAEMGWEVDLCLSIKKAGYRIVYDNDAYVNHYPGRRILGDDRWGMHDSKSLRRSQNMAYLNARFNPLIPAMFVFFRATLVGSRHDPGLLRGLLGTCLGRRNYLSGALKVIKAYWQGTVDGRKKRRAEQTK